jgi:hypothetical protein
MQSKNVRGMETSIASIRISVEHWVMNLEYVKHFFVATVLVAVAFSTTADAKEVRLLGGQVRITAPASAKIDNLGAYGTSIRLRRSGGFSPNLNVQRQRYFGGIRGYAAISRRQFSSLGFRLHGSRFYGKSVWKVGYDGVIGGRRLYFIAFAYQTSRGVVLLTATATLRQYSTVQGKQLEEMLSTARVFD